MVRWPAIVLVAGLTAAAGVLTLLGIDLDAFEERTGFFDMAGRLVIDAFLVVFGLTSAAYAASFFFPGLMGSRAGLLGAIVALLVAAFCLRVLWLGGA